MRRLRQWHDLALKTGEAPKLLAAAPGIQGSEPR